MENEEIKKIRKGRNIVFTFFACVMTALIVFLSTNLGQKLYDGINPNRNSSAKKCARTVKVDDNELIKIYNILGINSTEQAYLGLVSILPSYNKDFENLTIDEKKNVVYWYALNNNYFTDVIDPVTKTKYKGLEIDTFNKIKEYYGIKEDYNILFSSDMIKQNTLLFDEIVVGSNESIKHDLSSTLEKDNIIIKDNSTIGIFETNEIKRQIVQYTFKKNSNGNYYLAKSEIVE